jgi:hypothetical protein
MRERELNSSNENDECTYHDIISTRASLRDNCVWISSSCSLLANHLRSDSLLGKSTNLQLAIPTQII